MYETAIAERASDLLMAPQPIEKAQFGLANGDLPLIGQGPAPVTS